MRKGVSVERGCDHSELQLRVFAGTASQSEHRQGAVWLMEGYASY